MVSIGPQIRVSGESDYRMALRRIYSETKTLKNEMDQLSNSFKANDSALEKNRKTSEMLTRQIDAQKAAVDATTTTYNRAVQKFNDTTSAYELQRYTTEKLTHAYEISSQEVEKLTNIYGKNSDEVKAAKEEQKKLKEELTDSEKQQKKLYDEVFRSAYVMEDWEGKVAESKAELEEYRRELEKLPNSMQVVGQSLQESGDKLVEWGTNLSKYVSAPLAALGAVSVKNAASFEDGMAKIYTIATESQKPMSEMREELIQLSNETGYSLDDLAEAAYQSVSASVDAAKATEFMADAANLARGGFTSTTQAVDLLTTVINAYGYQAEDAAYISDVLLKTQNDGKTIIDELAQSMGTVIPTAANYNVSLEQLAGAYATMTKQGVNTSRATTFLNAMFTELEKESSAISKVLDEKTGKSFAQLMGEGESLADVLKILYDSVDQDNEQFQRLFGNIRSGKAAAALVRDDFSVLTNEIERMKNATGQTAYALDVLDTPALKVKKALNQLKNTTVDLGETFIQDMLPVLEDVVGGVKGFVNWFHELDDETKKTIARFVAFAAALGPVITVGGKVISVVGGITSGIGTLAKNVQLTGSLFQGLSMTLGTAGFIGVAMAAIAVFGSLILAAQADAEARRKEIEATWGLNEELKNLIQENETLMESYDSTTDAIEKNFEAELKNADYAEELVKRYNDLIGINGEVREGHEKEADVLLNELASALGITKDKLLEMIDENGKFNQSIYDSIAAIRERARAAALEQTYTAALKDKYDIEYQITKTEKALEEQTKKVTEAEKKAKEARDAVTQAAKDGKVASAELTQAHIDAENAYTSAKEAAEKLEKSLKDLKDQEKEAGDQAEWASDQMKISFEEANTNGTSSMAGLALGIKAAKDDGVSYLTELRNAAIGALTIDTYQKGKDFVFGFANAIKDFMGVAVANASSMGAGASIGLKNSIKQGSPSKVTYESGMFFDQGFINGIKALTDEAEQAARNLGQASVIGLNTYIPEPSSVSNNKTITMTAPITINVPNSASSPAEIGDAVALAMDRWLGERL